MSMNDVYYININGDKNVNNKEPDIVAYNTWKQKLQEILGGCSTSEDLDSGVLIVNGNHQLYYPCLCSTSQ